MAQRSPAAGRQEMRSRSTCRFLPSGSMPTHAAGLERFRLARDAAIEAAEAPNLLGGVVTLSASGRAETPADWADMLCRAEPPVKETVRPTAVPYFAWDNRDPGEMLV